MTAMADMWSASGPVACIHPGWDALVDRDEVIRSWAQILANSEAPSVGCRNPQPFLYGDYAFVVCQEVLAQGVLAATNIFVREDGRWKLIHHQASPLALLPSDEDPPQSGTIH